MVVPTTARASAHHTDRGEASTATGQQKR